MAEKSHWTVECQLSPEDIQDAINAFLSQRGRLATSIALGMIGFLMLAFYAWQPANLTWSLLAILCAGDMLLVIGKPVRQAKKTAKEFHSQKCRITLQADGYLESEHEGSVSLTGDRHARAIETSSLFVIRPRREQLYILPKRCMDAETEEGIRKILHMQSGKYLMRPAYNLYREVKG
jgi:hypothetical protein